MLAAGRPTVKGARPRYATAERSLQRHEDTRRRHMQSEGVIQAKAAALADFGGQGAAQQNCAQAVMLFALRALGEDSAVAEYARYFGGGIGRTGSTCGVITGATLALGVRD